MCALRISMPSTQSVSWVPQVEFLRRVMSRKRFFAAIFALLVGLSLGSTRLTGQTPTTGDIAGVVTDPSGASIPDAKVELKDIARATSRKQRRIGTGSTTSIYCLLGRLP